MRWLPVWFSSLVNEVDAVTRIHDASKLSLNKVSVCKCKCVVRMGIFLHMTPSVLSRPTEKVVLILLFSVKRLKLNFNAESASLLS